MTVTNIPRIPSTLLHEVSQVSQRYAEVQRYHAEKNREQNWEEQSRILALQEANRLLRNYNYMKDTEEIRQYVLSEGVKEQRLLNSYRVRGIFTDRYV
jgi:hypothetical protein